jgi:hypothetical protein
MSWMAIFLKEGLDIAMIAECTGLSVEEIENF